MQLGAPNDDAEVGTREREEPASSLRIFGLSSRCISKDIRATERIGATLIFQFSNILNHFQPANPSMNIDSPQTWGVVTNQATSANGLQARQIEFGLRLRF